MYIYTPLCRYWITLYRYVLVFIVPHVDIELEDNKQFISNIPCVYIENFENLVMNQLLDLETKKKRKIASVLPWGGISWTIYI